MWRLSFDEGPFQNIIAHIIAKSPAFITLKDHKENFQSKFTCRLINPCKRNLDKERRIANIRTWKWKSFTVK
jgi:hypothetical protein